LLVEETQELALDPAFERKNSNGCREPLRQADEVGKEPHAAAPFAPIPSSMPFSVSSVSSAGEGLNVAPEDLPTTGLLSGSLKLRRNLGLKDFFIPEFGGVGERRSGKGGKDPKGTCGGEADS
jgi:hypothetical protein